MPEPADVAALPAPCYPTRMSSSLPPPPSAEPAPRSSGAAEAPKRPRYLVVALVCALLFGAGCWTEGCSRLAFYRGERDSAHVYNASIKDEADRARADAMFRRYTEVADDARSRAVPLAAAIFVLGAALLALAARGLAGKNNTRSALLQVVVAQALVVGASYWITRDVRYAERDWIAEQTLIQQKQSLPPDQYEQVVPMVHAIRRVWDPTWLAIRTLASGLIVFALTRPRSRAFFEAAGRGAVSER